MTIQKHEYNSRPCDQCLIDRFVIEPWVFREQGNTMRVLSFSLYFLLETFNVFTTTHTSTIMNQLKTWTTQVQSQDWESFVLPFFFPFNSYSNHSISRAPTMLCIPVKDSVSTMIGELAPWLSKEITASNASDLRCTEGTHSTKFIKPLTFSRRAHILRDCSYFMFSFCFASFFNTQKHFLNEQSVCILRINNLHVLSCSFI